MKKIQKDEYKIILEQLINSIDKIIEICKCNYSNIKKIKGFFLSFKKELEDIVYTKKGKIPNNRIKLFNILLLVVNNYIECFTNVKDTYRLKQELENNAFLLYIDIEVFFKDDIKKYIDKKIDKELYMSRYSPHFFLDINEKQERFLILVAMDSALKENISNRIIKEYFNLSQFEYDELLNDMHILRQENVFINQKKEILLETFYGLFKTIIN